MIVMYIAFTDLSDGASSGSAVRPKKMLEAFYDIGETVFVVSGSDSYKNSFARKKSLARANEWLNTNIPDYCYVENSTSPVKLKGNWSLIKRLYKMNVPIGYFYRDFHYRFPEVFPTKTLRFESFKEKIFRIFYARDEKLVNKYVNILYLPSFECTKYFSHQDMRALPPAGNLRDTCVHSFSVGVHTIIYAGGVSSLYGIYQLLEAFCILNRECILYKLILVCREDETETLSDAAQEIMHKSEWIQVVHASEKDLEKYYVQAEAGVMPLQYNEYFNMSVSVKLFEYSSYGLPIIATPLKTVRQIVEQEKIGIVANGFTGQDIADAVEVAFKDSVLWQELSHNALKSIKTHNMWRHRALQVRNELINKKRK
ncbi:MAG: glycosyltransferase [Ruthenibacterium sp.]